VRHRIPDLFSMGQRVEYGTSGRVRPPLGLQLNFFRLVETIVWQFLADFVGGLVLGLALSDFGSASCLWLGYIGLSLHLMLIAHDIIGSEARHKVSHMRRVVKTLRVYNFAHLGIQSIYLLVQALWNKECMELESSSECGCNATLGGVCCDANAEGVCVRSQSYVDSLLFDINTEDDEERVTEDAFGKLMGLSSSTDNERANFTYGAVLLVVFWFTSAAMNQPAFDKHDGGASYHHDKERQRARLRKLVSLVRRVQIRSATIQKLWSSTQYVKTLMENLDSKGDEDTARAQMGMSTKDARKEQASIWATDSTPEPARAGSEIQAIEITEAASSAVNGVYYPIATLEGTLYRQMWSPLVIVFHPGDDDNTDRPGERAAGFDQFKGQDRWVVRKMGLGDDEDIDYYVAPSRDPALHRPSSTDVPWKNKEWIAAEWSPEHPNWDGHSSDADAPLQVTKRLTQDQSWKQKVNRGIEQYFATRARAAVKAKLRHLTGAWVEPMLDFARMSNWDVFYLVFEHMYMAHMAHVSQILIVMHTLSQGDVLAMPIFVSLFLHANIQYPKVRSGFWSSAIAWTILEMVLRFILRLEIDLGGWRATCKEEHKDEPYTALSNCAFVDDGNYQWYLVLLLIMLFHTRESMRRQGEWRATSSCILWIYGFVMMVAARLLQRDNVEWLVATVICMVTALGASYKSVLSPARTKWSEDAQTEEQNSHEHVTQCKYCKRYLRKLSESNTIRKDKPCLFRIAPNGKPTRGRVCQVCGSPTILNVERPEKDPADELIRSETAQGLNKEVAAEMIVVNLTFCPLMLELLYEGCTAGGRVYEGCTNRGKKMVEHAFAWARVVEDQTLLVMVIQPTDEFYQPGESEADQRERMRQYLEQHVEQHEKLHGKLTSSFGVRGERKSGWPEHLKVPSRVYIEPHDPDRYGRVSRFVRRKKDGTIEKRSRIKLRHAFDGVLRSMFDKQQTVSFESDAPDIAATRDADKLEIRQWTSFGHPDTTGHKWRITAYLRIHCTGSKYTIDEEHHVAGQTSWDLSAIHRFAAKCSSRSRFVRLVPRSLVVENGPDTVEPPHEGGYTTDGWWIPLCETTCHNATVAAATIAHVEKVVWDHIKGYEPNSFLEPGKRVAATHRTMDHKSFDRHLKFLLDDVHAAMSDETRHEVESRLMLLKTLEEHRAFVDRRTHTRRNLNDVVHFAPAQSLALAKQELINFYEQHWLRDGSIRKLEANMSGHNENALTKICREADTEMKAGRKLQSAGTYGMAVDVFLQDYEEHGPSGKLQGNMALAVLLESLRGASKKLAQYADQEMHAQSHQKALDLLNGAIDLYNRLFTCIEKKQHRATRRDAKRLQELKDDRAHLIMNYLPAADSIPEGQSDLAIQPADESCESDSPVSRSEAITGLSRHLNRTWGIALEDIYLDVEGVNLKAIVAGDIVRVSDSDSPSQDTGNSTQLLSVAYRVLQSTLAADAVPVRRYVWCLGRLQEQRLEASQIEKVDILPRPQQMRVVHDFHADKPTQLGYRHHRSECVAYTTAQQHESGAKDPPVAADRDLKLDAVQVFNYYNSRATTVEDWKGQARTDAGQIPDEPRVQSWYSCREGSAGLVPAGTTVIVIDQQSSGPWVVGFTALNPTELGEIPSSFVVQTPVLPEMATAMAFRDLLPSQRALVDEDVSKTTTVETVSVQNDHTGEQTLGEFEQDYGGFPSLHRDGVDLYTRAFLCEMFCLGLGAYVYASANAIDLNLSIGAAGQADAGESTLGMVGLMVGQFVFIMADRAAYLTQSIRGKIVLMWLSFCVYMTLIFGTFSEYTVPTCEESEVGTSAFCEGTESATSVTGMRIFGVVGLVVCMGMRWSFLSGGGNENLLGIMGGMINQVIWGGIITTDDLAVIIQASESLCYVALVYSMLSTNRDRTFSEVLFFCLKAYYWYLSAEQIRYGYKVEAGKLSAQLLTSKTTLTYHYTYLVWTAAPFLNEIRVAWDWTFSKTTLEYFDAVKLDQMQKFTYLAHCRLFRLRETGRVLGEPQLWYYRLVYGIAFALVFTGCLWGPMLLFVSSIDFHTYNVNDASLTIELQLNRLNVQLAEFTLHETISMEDRAEDFVDDTLLFTEAVAQDTGNSNDLKKMYTDADVHFEEATAFWSRKDTYVEQVQSIVTGKYPSQSWRATRHTRRQIVNDLNGTLAVRTSREKDQVATSSSSCDVPNTACLIFTLTFEKSATASDNATIGQQTLKFPESIVLGYDTTATLATAINATLMDGEAVGSTGDVREELSVVIDRAILPVMILKHDGTQVDVTVSDGSTETPAVPRIPIDLALRAESLQGSIQEWYWTVSATGIGAALVEDEFFREKHCGGLSKEDCSDTWGLCLAVLNDKYPLDDTGLAILELGMFAIYATFIYAVASAYKLWTYKTMRDILLTDMDRVKFLWSKIQDINTARALAKRNTDYFMVEEKLWWDLHSIFRDPAKLYGTPTAHHPHPHSSPHPHPRPNFSWLWLSRSLTAIFVVYYRVGIAPT
jgi:hypothetical protein